MPFQSFQSGCGTCNASTDYPDIYYSQNPTLASNTVPSGFQTGGAKKKRSISKKKSTTKVSKKKSTSTKKSTSKVSKKKRSMCGGASESFQLDDQFIRDNLGISFETVGGATYMPPQYYKGGILDSLRTGTMAGYDAMDGKLAPLTGGKKKRSATKGKKVGKKKTTSKKSVKKVTKKKSTKKVSKKKTTKKVASSWKLW